jgi:hypothetical protein
MFSLKRERDGAGDSGSMSTVFWKEDGEIKFEDYSKPRIGTVVRVGSFMARTYEQQDYWTTSYITEILEDQGNYVKFKTGNSVYEWKVF